MDHLLSQLEKDLDELTLLKGYVENEALVFHKLQLFGPALSTFISTLRSIVSEISSVRDNLDCLLHNKTQAKFVELLRPILGNLGADIEIVMWIMNEHLTTTYHVEIYPAIVYQSWSFMGDLVAAMFDYFVDRRIPESISAMASQTQPSPSHSISAESDNNEMRARKNSFYYNSTGSSSERTSGILNYNLGARSPGGAPTSSQKGLSARTFDALSDGVRYFEAGSKSIKIKSMLDRRKFYHVTRHPEEEEKLFSSPSSDCGECEGSDPATYTDRHSDVDTDIESKGGDRNEDVADKTSKSSYDSEVSISSDITNKQTNLKCNRLLLQATEEQQ